MQETMTAIVDAVTAANGDIHYNELVTQLGAEHRRNLPVALRRLKAAGTIAPWVGRNADSGNVEYRLRLPAAAPTPPSGGDA